MNTNLEICLSKKIKYFVYCQGVRGIAYTSKKEFPICPNHVRTMKETSYICAASGDWQSFWILLNHDQKGERKHHFRYEYHHIVTAVMR